MKSRKKMKKAVIIAVAVTGVVGGGAAGVTAVRKNSGKAVEVTPVSDVNMGDVTSWSGDDGVSGQVVSNVSQSVRVPDGKVIDQVYVKEGDKVKIGDKLLSYDTTLLELDKELQEITVMELGLEIKSAEADLTKLQNAKPGDPILDNLSDRSAGSLADSADDVDTSDDGSDSGDEEARLVGNERDMLAAQENTGDTGSSDTPEMESTESTQTESSTDDAQQTETDSSLESEVIIDQTETGSGEVLTPDDLDQTGNGSGADNGDQTADSNAGQDKPEKNQSLEQFFTNVRMKTADEEETLLADIKPGEQTENTLNGDIKIIPHFCENSEYHFQTENTYTMELSGVKLDQQIEGKVYGTAQINGEDYPEIGGFILAQKNGSEDTALLTIAFHDGLDQQHEVSPQLEDMYLELTLKKGSLCTDQLVLHTGNEKKDAVIALIQEMTEDQSEVQADTQDTQQPETQILNLQNQDAEEEEETGSEITASDTVQLQNIHFRINWNHGNNARENWPASMKAYFYQKGITEQDDPDCIFTLTRGSSVAGMDTGVDGTDSSIDEETTTEVTTEPETEGSTSDSQDTEAETEEATDITEVITEDDTVSTHETWQNIDVKIPESMKLDSDTLGVNSTQWSERWSGYAPDYSMEVADIQISNADASATVILNMTYNKPEDNPLLKLNPISELTWQHGMNTLNETGMRAYKGSGTAEDPYVFFVTDGVKITNTFVNWVLGFNEDGTQRVSDGYYVRLEIRESDTITGAFIRSIDLDGTILTDHGYGPGTYWIFNSETGITKYEEEVPDDNGGGGDPGWDNDNDGTGYTAEELAQAIEEKKLEIQKLKLDERQAKLKLKSYNKEMDDSTVVSAVDGYVKSINGAEEDAYMVVDSENGLYVKTTVSELELDNVSVDQTINCSSWDTGAMFTATITEIDAFPSSEDNSDGYYGGSGNVNSSSYPVLAVIDDATADSLSEYESVNVTYPTEDMASGDAIYLEKAYIRSENGQSYVYIADENQKLKKQYIRTGGTVWGYIEIKQGLTTDDQIAFPYGKNVKEGAAVKLAGEEE